MKSNITQKYHNRAKFRKIYFLNIIRKNDNNQGQFNLKLGRSIFKLISVPLCPQLYRNPIKTEWCV